MKISYYKYSNQGPRLENQDSLDVINYFGHSVACVADGVGGSNCGKLASVESVKYFMDKTKDSNKSLNGVLKGANDRIKELQTTNPLCKGMATTFTGCVLSQYVLNGVHIGDSRLCILRGNGIKQLTENHTEVEALLKAGKLRKEDVDTYPRKHILTRAIKGNDLLTIQSFQFTLRDGDRIILTTDGVHDHISKMEFRDLSIQTNSADAFGNGIENLLSTKDLSDNVSFIILQIG